jgi:hypothetical protein
MIVIALFVLQDLVHLEKIRGQCSEVCPASPHDTYQAISNKTEVLSDAEEEEDSDPVTYQGIMAEPEVSCVPMSILGRFHKYKVSLVL